MTLAGLLFAVVVILAAFNESRLDVYVSVFAVSYFATSSIFNPRRRMNDFLGLSLFLVFSFIVALRVLEILMK
jgi:hypothetical protein